MNKLTKRQTETILSILQLLKSDNLMRLEIDVLSPIFTVNSDSELSVLFQGADIRVNTSYLYEDKIVFHFTSGQQFEVLL